MSLVSIVIPIYNGARFLRETLNSVMEQSFDNWECLLMNDQSTDDSRKICEEYMHKDHRFKLYNLKNHGSADLPIAKGMEYVSSPFCLCIGHDDVLEKLYLEKLLNKQASTQADIVLPLFIGSKHELEGELYRIPMDKVDKTKVLTGADALSRTIGGWNLSCNGMLYRTEFNYNIMRGSYMNSDELSSRQILERANLVVYSDAVYRYRNHNESISRRVSARLWERMFVDEEIVRFVKSRNMDTKVIDKAIISYFYNFLHLIGEIPIQQRYLSKQDRLRIVCAGRGGYCSLNNLNLNKILPKHYRCFFHGYLWFRFVAIIYTLIYRLRGKVYYYA